MLRFSCPVDIQELKCAIELAVISARPIETALKPENLPFELSFSDMHLKASELPLTGDLECLLANYEREILKNVLNKHNWNQTAAAKEHNISERTMRYKIQ